MRRTSYNPTLPKLTFSTVSTTALAIGGHQVTVTATDSHNLSTEAWTGFEIAASRT